MDVLKFLCFEIHFQVPLKKLTNRLVIQMLLNTVKRMLFFVFLILQFVMKTRLINFNPEEDEDKIADE